MRFIAILSLGLLPNTGFAHSSLSHLSFLTASDWIWHMLTSLHHLPSAIFGILLVACAVYILKARKTKHVI